MLLTRFVHCTSNESNLTCASPLFIVEHGNSTLAIVSLAAAGTVGSKMRMTWLVEEWAVNYPLEDVMRQMQAAGVPSGIVADGRDLHADPQLQHLHHSWRLGHPEMGVTAYDGPGLRLSKTPDELKMPTPCLGQHTEYICREILQMSDK